ncbi:MAG: hypothetical protein LBS56_06765 [Propionibacteriaceae bacterium]|jgi:hypothetical protein|nr:hypothetical protein [Propionibacteriaceae bacterium]
MITTSTNPAHPLPTRTTVPFADMPRVEPWLDEITPWHVAASGHHERALIGTSGPVCLEVEDSHEPGATEIERTLWLSVVVPGFRVRSAFGVQELCGLSESLGVPVGDLWDALWDAPARRRHFDLGLDAARALHAGLGEALAAVDALTAGGGDAGLSA